MRGLGGKPQDAPVIAFGRAQGAPLEKLLCLVDIGNGEAEGGEAARRAGRRRGEIEPHIAKLDGGARRIAARRPVGAAAE